MSFAALRQTVLRAHCLGSDRFAEDVQMTAADAAGGDDLVSVRAKIQHESYGPSRRFGTGVRNEQRLGTSDERERIEVTVSRDATYARSYVSRPPLACCLYRAEARDPDRRPFTFRGEVLFEGDQHAVYVFERTRRGVQGKGS